jgi:hypothetical protein
MKNIVWFASAAFALAVVPGSLSQAQTTSDKQVVQCTFEYSTGYSKQDVSCFAWQLGPFTKVPSGKFLSITDVTVMPLSDSDVSGDTSLDFQIVLGEAQFALFNLRQRGGNSFTHSWRTPPLVLSEGTNLRVSTWYYTTMWGKVIVTGILSSDYNAAVR